MQILRVAKKKSLWKDNKYNGLEAHSYPLGRLFASRNRERPRTNIRASFLAK